MLRNVFLSRTEEYVFNGIFLVNNTEWYNCVNRNLFTHKTLF